MNVLNITMILSGMTVMTLSLFMASLKIRDQEKAKVKENESSHN